MPRRLLHILILSCKTATLLMEKRLDAKLSFRENLQLRVHIILCKWCSVYNQKAKLIHLALKKNFGKKKEIYEIDIEKIKSGVINKLR